MSEAAQIQETQTQTQYQHQLYGPSERVWNEKYRLKRPDGQPVDLTVEDTWWRIARALAEPENDPFYWTEEFYKALEDFKFIPAGRIIAGVGTGRSVTLQNCYVLGTIEDSMEGIFDSLKEAALTLKQGGGIGMDFSTLRPRGAPVRGVDSDSSGPLSFMDCWDTMCRTIMSAGSRRGAMMGTMQCDHPDIEAFVEAKSDPNRFRMFNLSVLCTDSFMKQVKQDGAWPLQFHNKVYKTIQARDLWDKIMRSTYNQAEPGVIFIDRINQLNNLYYCESISATNPCGEVPLPPYGGCLLGSINLAALVEEPFTNHAHIDIKTLLKLTSTAIRMMDNVIEVSKYPLPVQEQQARGKRRLGLGITGYADALIMCRAKYGSPEALMLLNKWLSWIRHLAYQTSIQLAQEKGPFPLLEKDAYLKGEYIRSHPEEIIEGIKNHGIRNSHLIAIAPTGTISYFANYISGGIEPVFSFSHARKTLNHDGSFREEEVQDYAYREWQTRGFSFPHERHAPYLPDYFVDAQTLPPEAHLDTLATAQRWVCQSISKTINLPEDIPFEEFESIYLQAHEKGCKSCTTYRPNDITGAVLQAQTQAQAQAIVVPLFTSEGAEEYEDEDEDEAEMEADPEEIMRAMEEELLNGATPPLARRPSHLQGSTYKVRWEPAGGHAFYITINDIIEDGERPRPFEIFLNSKDVSSYAWMVGLSRMISAIFRRGGDLGFVTEELKAVFDPKGGSWIQGKMVPSLLAAIGDIIEEHIKMIADSLPPRQLAPPLQYGLGAGLTCPKCGRQSMIHTEGCVTCQECGYSNCS
jgi:ribonucleoside-diphosphate reductase alpha chain